MEDDLKYPAGLIAGENWERKISTLKSGVGSMPGKPHEEAEAEKHDMQLQSGRGVIP